MVTKKIKGRKRHIVVDSIGQILAVKVHEANHFDSKAGVAVVDKAVGDYFLLKMICGDQGYNGTTTVHVIEKLEREMMISARIKDTKESPKRWIVERTFAWLGNFRRLSLDYEKLINFAENMVKIAMIRLGVKKLCIN